MIACLGWGSLIWDVKELPIEDAWNPDGPMLPVEFNRVSKDGRLTLVIMEGSPPVSVLWSTLSVASLDDGIQALAKREDIPKSSIRYSIGVWSEARSTQHAETVIVGEWARQSKLSAVIWTALKPGLKESRGSPLTRDDVLAHLKSLEGAKRARAEEYIRRAPCQIRTPYRSVIEHEFGWRAD